MEKIVIEDLVFRLGVEEISGIIHAEQGLPVFYCKERGIIAKLPVTVSADAYEQRVRTYIYPTLNRLLVRLDKDDKLISDFKEEDIDVLTEQEYLEAIVEEEKIKQVPDILRIGIQILLSVGLTIASFVFRVPLAIGCSLGALLISILNFRRLGAFLNSGRVYDRRGHWVDLSTGETNLNGGFKIPQNRDVHCL